MHNEHEELVKLALELREILFDDANDMMQGAMVGCPVECVAFAKWWIQRAKNIPFDDPFDACAFRGSNVKVRGCALLRSPSRLPGWASSLDLE